jgi:hypothetical protein
MTKNDPIRERLRTRSQVAGRLRQEIEQALEAVRKAEQALHEFRSGQDAANQQELERLIAAENAARLQAVQASVESFETIRQELAAHRLELEQTRKSSLLAGEAVRKAEDTLKAYTRLSTEGDKRQELEQRLKRSRARQKEIISQLGELQGVERVLLDAFHRLTDPRLRLRQWSDSSPILLFPLRLETRFKANEAGKPQLWVRVYPDTCLVDTFEESLSDQEAENARIFWAGIWRAGGDEEMERVAWRELVAAHGSGRAGWIVRQPDHMPQNLQDAPQRTNSSDVHLIIISETALPAEVITYWEAAWRAGENAAAQKAAFDALSNQLGEQAANDFVKNTKPFNFEDTPQAGRTRQNVTVRVVAIQFLPAADLPTRRLSWSSAAHVDLLPEQFILICYGQSGEPLVSLGNPVLTPLIVSADPNAPPEEQLKPDGDTLQIAPQLLWMFDFEKALEVGMAFRVDLTAEQASQGFSRVVVLGVRLADSASLGVQDLGTLLTHHLHSRGGLEILPQGTPTNNTEKSGSGYSFREDANRTFEVFFKQNPQYGIESEPLLRRDGQWLAEFLGLPHPLVQSIPGAGLLDQSEARAMQIALWPGTLGYMMKTMLAPVFSPGQVQATRYFFTRYVSGRGPLPALRIGAQPYGILPTTDFSRVNWFDKVDRTGYLRGLVNILKKIQSDWDPLLKQVSFLGKQDGSDPHQVLLNVLGLHSGSVEYYPLQAQSLEHKFYELAFFDFALSLNLLELYPSILPLTLLRSFGYTGDQVPDLFNKIIKARQTPLNGPLIDDRPLSESDPIRNYAGNRNYIEWLVQAAQTGIQAIQQEQGFDENKKPAALLYLLLRHALQLSFDAASVQLRLDAGMIENTNQMYREPTFVHIQQSQQGSESRYAPLFQAADSITGQSGLLLGDFIAQNLRTIDPDLREQIEALERLSCIPTVHLERLFAEHIDTVSYRLDAWKTGLISLQLEQRRDQQVREKTGGIYLGAYGWIEPLRPENKQLTPVELDEDLDKRINLPGQPPLMQDSTNQGLIHAPSINHATTAAVLRNGYIANDGRLAVNLTSRRVRLALGILEGMRNGQSIGALLGYQFERYVHDHGPLQVRALVYPMRRAFPLAADQIQDTVSEEGEAKESIAAMNVVDGRKLLEHVESVNNFIYPFGVDTLPRCMGDQEAAMTDALDHIRDINDAVADLVLAEGVHQAVMGNYDRSAGTLEAFAKGNYPPEPDVIRTPRTGITLTLRTAIHLTPTSSVTPIPGMSPTSLAKAEPALDAWLKKRLPPPADVGCEVDYTDRTTNSKKSLFISQQNLKLHPIDLLYRVDTDPNQALNDLDDRILHFLYSNHSPRLDRQIRIQYTRRVTGKVSWFELQALLRSLRVLTVSARPLQPADLMRQNDAKKSEQSAALVSPTRVEAARSDLNGLLPSLQTLSTTLGNPATDIEAALQQYFNAFQKFADYRLPNTGTGHAYEWRANLYDSLADKIAQRLTLWARHLAQYDLRITAYDNLPLATPENERMQMLQAAEILIHTQLSPGVNSGAYRLALNTTRGNFVARHNALQALIDASRPTLAQLVTDLENLLPLTEFDPTPFEIDEEKLEIEGFRSRLADSVKRLQEDVEKRIEKVDALLAQANSASLQEAAKLLFGEDFQLIPQITLPDEAAQELANAWQHSTSGKLTHYLTDPTGIGRDFPVDDWLHGVARVREKLHHWENALLLGEAFEVEKPIDLVPLQLPHGPDEPWLALEIPTDYKIVSDRLLYNAHFEQPFDPSQPVCGLLVDEWTEVIPGLEETTGISFHYDRPNAEPPQAWLLVTPATQDGVWSWEELLTAVNDSLDAAKRRAIEPTHIDTTAYSWFLPATMSAYTFPEISISNNLLRNLEIYAKLAKE